MQTRGTCRALWIVAALWSGAACDGGDERSSESLGGGTTTTGAVATTTGPAEVSTSGSTDPATTAPSTTGAPDLATGSSSTGEPLPEGPSCSVQVTTHGALFDPLPRGKTEDAFPPDVADVLEDRCGCHTLMNNGQNIEHEFQRAPGGTLFLALADLDKPFKNSTLGAAMAEEVAGLSMPPGSCAFPSDEAMVLQAWFDAGHPSGATFP